MPELNVTMLILFSFPETLVLAWLSLSLIGFRPECYQLLKIGFLQTLFDAFFFLVVTKMLSLPFGVHTVIEMVVNSWIIQRVMGISYKSSCLAIVFGFTVYISIESLLLPLVIFLTGHSLPVINENNWLMRLPYFVLQLTVNVVLIFFIRRLNIRLTEAGPIEKNICFLRLGSLLFIHSFLVIVICYQYYSYQEHGGMIEASFITANTILPIVTLIIVGEVMVSYLWKHPKKYFYRSIK